jgi:hypothetical protein
METREDIVQFRRQTSVSGIIDRSVVNRPPPRKTVLILVGGQSVRARPVRSGSSSSPGGVGVLRVPPPAGRGLAPIYANLTSRYTYPASVLVCFNHLAWSLSVAFCQSFCNEIPAFETFTQRQNRIYCASEQIKCKRCFPPPIRLGGIFFTDVRATIPLPLEYAGVFLIPERRWGFLILVCAEDIPRGKKNVLARQLQR